MTSLRSTIPEPSDLVTVRMRSAHIILEHKRRQGQSGPVVIITIKHFTCTTPNALTLLHTLSLFTGSYWKVSEAYFALMHAHSVIQVISAGVLAPSCLSGHEFATYFYSGVPQGQRTHT